jgi:DNA mismatch repair protein MutL
VEPASAPAVVNPRAERLLETTLLLRDAADQPREQPSGNWSAYRFLAQVRQTYLVCESDDGLCVLDQHAAAERVMFAKLREQYAAAQVASQALLFPVTISVSADEAEQFELQKDTIEKLGLEVSVRGSDHISVHSVPRLLQRVSPERLIRDLLTELSRSGGRAFSDAIDKALATMACHAAIRAGDVINHDEASALLCALDDADFAGYCPHGRPIIAFLSWAELERKVGRR